MSLDFGGLAALSGVDNWAEKRQARAQDLQYEAIMNAMAERKNQQQQLQQQEVQDYLTNIGQVSILKQDKERIQAKEQELSANIQKGIKKAHGNLDEYLNTGGQTELAKYRNNLLDSDEVNQGLLNAFNKHRALVDRQQGLTPRMTSWQEGDKQVQGSIDENIAAHEAGKTHEINYGGGFEEPTGDPAKDFSSRYGNAEGKPQVATAQDVYDYWLNAPKGKGMTEQDRKVVARQKAVEYAQQHGAQGEKGGYPFKFEKQPSLEDLQYKRYRNEVMRNRALQQIKNSSDSWEALTSGENAMDIHKDPQGAEVVPNLNVDANSYNQLFGAPPDEKNIGQQTKAGYKATPMSDADKKAMGSIVLGMTYHKPKTGQEWSGWEGNIINGDKLVSAQNLMPLKGNINDYKGKFRVSDIDHSVVVLPPQGANLPARRFVLAHVDIDRSAADNLGIWEHSAILPDRANKASEGAGRQGVTTKGDLGRVFPILVPIDNIPLNLREAFTKKVKLGTLSNEDIESYMNQPEPAETGEE